MKLFSNRYQRVDLNGQGSGWAAVNAGTSVIKKKGWHNLESQDM